MLKRNEILALIIDWGYRADGIPVRMFGSWTTLPAGPAALAAKTGAPIVHIAIRRSEDRPVVPGDATATRSRSHSSDPAEIRRATQAIADALAATIAAAPEQWYSFKPIWPSTAEEQAVLAERAEQSRRPGPGGLMTAGPRRSIGSRLRARAIVAASWLACRLPERPLLALADLAGDLAYRLAPERRTPRAPEPRPDRDAGSRTTTWARRRRAPRPATGAR